METTICRGVQVLPFPFRFESFGLLLFGDLSFHDWAMFQNWWSPVLGYSG